MSVMIRHFVILSVALIIDTQANFARPSVIHAAL